MQLCDFQEKCQHYYSLNMFNENLQCNEKSTHLYLYIDMYIDMFGPSI